MNILINYADLKYFGAQKNNSQSGLSIGGFHRVVEHARSSLAPEFVEKNRLIFDQFRGAGYWIWKPYIIYQSLLRADKDDIIFYCDAGCTFTENMEDYFEICKEDEKGLILFDGLHINKIYTKRDCFVYMGMDEDRYVNGSQLTATFQLCRKTEFSLEFYRQYIEHVEDARILTDAPNVCGLPNYEGFLDHRHDQSIASLMAIQQDVTLLEDPSQWGDEVRRPSLPRVIQHHRCSL